MWMESWNTLYPNDKLYCNAADAEGYFVGTELEPTSISIDSTIMKEYDGYDNTLFYPHQSAYNSCWAYWLASPSAYNAGDVLHVYCNGSVSRNYYNNSVHGVRVLVCLKSDISGTLNGEVWELDAN